MPSLPELIEGIDASAPEEVRDEGRSPLSPIPELPEGIGTAVSEKVNSAESGFLE